MENDTAHYGQMIEVTRLGYNTLNTGDLIENLDYPYEIGLVKKLLSCQRSPHDGRLLSTYSVESC